MVIYLQAVSLIHPITLKSILLKYMLELFILIRICTAAAEYNESKSFMFITIRKFFIFLFTFDMYRIILNIVLYIERWHS